MLTNNEKIILGKLFKIYAKEVTIADIEYADISSTRTLYNAYEGKIIKSDDFYIKYCYFFNKDFKAKSNFDEWLKNYLIKLIDAFEYYDKQKITHLYDELVTELYEYKDSAIYCEYWNVLSSLFNYYLNNKYLKLEELNYYLELIELRIFDDNLNIYLLDYMFRSNNNYIGDKKLPQIIIEKMNSINNRHILTKYWQAALYKYDSKFLLSLKLLEECYLESKRNNNSYRTVRYLLAQYSIYKNIDVEMERKIRVELLEMKHDKNLHKNLHEDINYNIGMYDYLNGNYESAYKLLKENVLIHKSMNALLFLCSSCSHLNKELPKDIINGEIENRYDYIYLEYYKKVSEGEQEKKLAQYIVNTIVPKKLKFEKNRNPYWTLFEYELYKITKNNKSIDKYYFKYFEKLQKTCLIP